jgi:hypothetical protein
MQSPILDPDVNRVRKHGGMINVAPDVSAFVWVLKDNVLLGAKDAKRIFNAKGLCVHRDDDADCLHLVTSPHLRAHRHTFIRKNAVYADGKQFILEP